MRDRRVEGCGQAGAGGGRCLRSRSGYVIQVTGCHMGVPPEHSSSAAFFCPAPGPQVIMAGLCLLTGQVTQCVDFSREQGKE